MNCKYKVNIKDIQYNYKVKMEEIQSKYKFNIFCRGYDDSDIKGKIDDMYNAWPKVTGEGEEITLNDTVSAKMSLGLKGNTSQEGTPTPESPQDIHVVSGDNTVKVEGKNLVSSLNKVGNTIYFNGYNSQELYPYKAGTYTLSYKDTNSVATYLKVSSGTQQNLGTNKTITFTANENFQLWFWRSGLTIEELSEVQLERNSTATTYTPYISASYPINLPEGMYMGWIGNYQDYIYKQDKKWYKYGAIGKVVWNNSLVSQIGGTFSTMYSNGYICRYLPGTPLNVAILTNETLIYCNRLKSTSNSLWNGANGQGIKTSSTSSAIYLALSVPLLETYSGTTLTSENNRTIFEGYLTNNSTNIYYVLSTPTTTEITDTTLISQLDAIEKAESYKGQTNISQVNNDAPFIITASTLKDLSSLGTSTVSTLNTASVNRLGTQVLNQSIDPVNLELNSEDLELNNEEETIEETPEER